ncbi:MAG: hypothetical protein H6737_25935 [Alphaproteobacteria bacterium]|nr:hypothetical protein [Alphaproteobacteria bacterium]
MIALLTWLWVASSSAARPGTEFVIVLDNSCSMIENHTIKGHEHPAADPDRRSVLGALLVEGLTTGTDDELTVIAFPRANRPGSRELTSREQIERIGPSFGTYYQAPLTKAREILEGSERNERMLLFLSDGAPNDYEDPMVGRRVLGLPDVAFDTLVLALLAEDDPTAEGFMKPLARHPEDYVRVTDGAALVSHFTAGYARALGSKAVSGTLQPGGEHTVEVGRYVTEVLAVTTSVDPTGPYKAELSGPSGKIRARAEGDNGCNFKTMRNPTYCDPPRMHYAVWRAPHDPEQTDWWTLRLAEGSGGEVAWGFILRYDLTAEALLPEKAKVGVATPVRGRLVVDGKPFDDAQFFASDGFEAEARIGDQTIPMTHVGDGVFEGSWTPDSDEPASAEIRFRNAWMEKRARGTIQTERPPELELSADRGVLDFGQWRGERRATERCVPFRPIPSHAIVAQKTAFTFPGVPDDIAISVSETPNGYEACARARGCCGDLVAPEGASLRIEAVDAEGSRAVHSIPIRYQVDRTGFLRCWWPWLLALLVLLFLIWFLYGWIRPHDFDEDLTIKVAGSERQLSRAASLVLREQPKGRRGFYRNARMSLTATGDFVANPRNAAVWIEATGAGDTRIHLRGPLEIKDTRTKKWVRVEPEAAADGVRTNVLYRLGDIYFRFQ